jgi:hypothetical protein
MSYSDAYDTCMAQKGLPLLGEIFSRHTISEAVATLSEIQQQFSMRMSRVRRRLVR